MVLTNILKPELIHLYKRKELKLAVLHALAFQPSGISTNLFLEEILTGTTMQY